MRLKKVFIVLFLYYFDLSEFMDTLDELYKDAMTEFLAKILQNEVHRALLRSSEFWGLFCIDGPYQKFSSDSAIYGMSHFTRVNDISGI